MLAVNDPQEWHAQNLYRNLNHYSIPAQLAGASVVARVQQSGAAVYFNTLLSSHGTSFKYGVVSTASLVTDLMEWDSFYVSGRLQKPVRMLTSAGPLLKKAMRQNTEAAAAAALLTLPESFDEQRFYTAIASLSYTRDVRMSMAVEARTKVRDIVRANMRAFRTMYASCDTVRDVVTRGSVWRRDIGAEAQQRLVQRLPSRIRDVVNNSVGNERDQLQQVHATRVGNAVLAAIGSVVARSSVTQAAKGVASAGLTTSVRYVAAKIGKSIRSAWRS
ncbi:translocator assembly and maintenance protein 41 isoform X2 [Gracilaria domingensis]|nr:translocator assembly and maintenance protein 41 isoform X2 [Gracilaria domingensis]